MMDPGQGSTLHFEIAGLLRGNEYGAIDVGGIAELDGAAIVAFASGLDFT